MDFFGIQRTTFDYKIDYKVLYNIYAVHLKYAGDGAYLILRLYS